MRWISLLVSLLVLATRVDSQQALPPEPGSKLSIYLMTMGPGQDVWERFGHIAIGVRDSAAGTDLVYNYGVFSFTQKNFLLRFIQGRMLYWMESNDAATIVPLYIRARRSVRVQELNLSPRQRLQLQKFLQWNALEENKYYRYDYYRDNCSTRVRDALDRVLGGVIRRNTASVPTETTYRYHTQRLTTNDLPIYTGMLIAMGHPVDQPISAWEEMFLPFAVREHLRTIKVPGSNGQDAPLVTSERTIYQSDAFVTRQTPPNWLPQYLLLGVLIGGGAFLLASLGGGRGWARTGFVTVGTFWYLLIGLGGLILLGLWGLTDHAVTYWNENVLQFNLLALPLVVWVPLASRRGGKTGRVAVRLSAAVAILSLTGLLLKMFPAFYQANLQVIALTLPAHAGVTMGLQAMLRQKPM